MNRKHSVNPSCKSRHPDESRGPVFSWKFWIPAFAGMTTFLSVLSVPTFAQTIPSSFNFQGRLVDTNNNPISGSRNFVFSLFSAPSGGTSFWCEAKTLAVTNGVYFTQVGNVVALSSAVFTSSSTYLDENIGGTCTNGVLSGGNSFTPRTYLVAVPYAMTAGNVAPGSGNYIQNTGSLQAGATFYVSSGTVAGTFSVGGNAIFDSSITVGNTVASSAVNLGSLIIGGWALVGGQSLTNASSFQFTGLDPSLTYKLVMEINGTGTANGTPEIQFNGDAGNDYNWETFDYVYSGSANTGVNGSSDTASIKIRDKIYSAAYNFFTERFAAVPGSDIVMISGNDSGWDSTGGVTNNPAAWVNGGFWHGAAALNSVTFTDSGGTFSGRVYLFAFKPPF